MIESMEGGIDPEKPGNHRANRETDPPLSPPASYGAYHPSKEPVNSPLTSIPQRLRYK
jgi:hypothetical protein